MSSNKGKLEKRIAAINEKPRPDHTSAFDHHKKQARDAERQPTFRFGHVYIDGRTEIPCIIKDMSSKGARIVLEGDIGLPPIVLFKAESMSVTKRAAVIWQEDREAGLAFQKE
jgi:hypothetical protein